LGSRGHPSRLPDDARTSSGGKGDVAHSQEPTTELTEPEAD
jgi:hypothetical protein